VTGKRAPEQVIEAAALNRRVQIQTETSTQDSYGQPVMTWTTVYTCWAEIAPYISARGSGIIFAGEEFLSRATTEITIRWTSMLSIEPNMRVIYTEVTSGVVHTYNVESVLNPGQANRQMIIKAYELDSGE